MRKVFGSMPRHNPYSRKHTPIRWGRLHGNHVQQDTQLGPGHAPAPAARHASGHPVEWASVSGHTPAPGHDVQGPPEHAPVRVSGHASGDGPSRAHGGSSGSSSGPVQASSGTLPPDADLGRSRRSGAPALLAYSRGSREAALQIAGDPSLRTLALQNLEAKRYAPSAQQGRQARSQLWHDVVLRASLGDPLAPSADMVFAVVAILRAAGYRAAVQVAEQAVLTARLRNFPVPPSVAIALKDARRASQRGLGPAKQSSPIPVERLRDLENRKQAEHPQGPLWPVRSIVLACWWLLREIEMSSVAQREVSFTPQGEASILLSVSKTDPRALGATRSHRCACGSVPDAPRVLSPALCPYCCLKEHLHLLQSSGLAAPDAPLFPTATGLPPSKRGVVLTITALMSRLGLPAHSASGAPLWGGTQCVWGGSSTSAAPASRLQRIQALARHSSNAIFGYLQGAHAQAIGNIAAEAGLARSLATVQQQLQALQSQVDSTRAPAQSPPPGASSVWNPGTSSKVHYLRPSDPGKTLCGWQWQHCLTVIRDPPPYVASVCAACRRSYVSPATDPPSTSDSSDSSSSTA